MRLTSWRLALADFPFATQPRIQAYSLILMVVTTACLVWIATHTHQLSMPDGQPIGTDFSDIYTAGQLALEGKAALAYDWGIHHAVQQRLFGTHTPYYAWSYPPPFLLLAAPLALFSYATALALWQVVTLLLYVWTVRLILPALPSRYWLLPCLAFSGVFINMANGHNGFLSAFLMGSGLALLRTRPIIAGILLGALCYKPQLGLLIPLALAAGGYWRSFLSASLCVLGLCLLSYGVFGSEVWIAFVQSLSLTQHIILEQGSTGWYKLQSLFAAARDQGLAIRASYGLQLVLTIGLAIAVGKLWRLRRAPFAYQAALLIFSCLLVTPYCLDYDLVMLAPAIAFLCTHAFSNGFAPYEKLLICFLWILPLIARTVMQTTGLPIGCITLMTSVILIYHHGRNAARISQPKAA